MGEPRGDSKLTVRKLTEMAVGLYAEPSYLRQMGQPVEPDELLGLHGLLMMSLTGEAREWTLERGPGNGSRTHWRGKPHQFTIANSPAVLMRMAEAGFGVVSLPDFIVHEAVKRGVLTRVLPEWILPRFCGCAGAKLKCLPFCRYVGVRPIGVECCRPPRAVPATPETARWCNCYLAAFQTLRAQCFDAGMKSPSVVSSVRLCRMHS